MTFHYILFLFFLSTSLARDELRAYDCSDPEILQVLKHNECDLPHRDSKQISYNILQESRITHLEGVSCELSISRDYTYCGAYSHTKPTPYSSLSIPTPIEYNQCRKIMEDSTYIYNEQSLKVDMNSATVHSLVTKGQITHSNSNIFCNGENVRMPDGSLIQNMVLVEHLIFKVHKVDLINDDGAIILPSEQVVLGPADNVGAHHKLVTYVWAPPDTSCNLLFIGNYEFLQTAENQLTSYQHGILLTTGKPFFHRQCGISVLMDDMHSFYLTTDKISQQFLQIDEENVMPAPHFSSQLRFLHKVATELLKSSKEEKSPECSRKFLSRKEVFTMSAGDVTLSYKCRPVTVTPHKRNTCFKRFPVLYEGLPFFIDATNRIMYNYSAPAPCTAGNVPILATMDNEYIALTPSIVFFHPDKQMDNGSSAQEQLGIYPQSIIREHMKTEYIHHFSRESYTLTSSYIQDKQSPVFSPSSHSYLAKHLNYLAKTVSHPLTLSAEVAAVFSLINTITAPIVLLYFVCKVVSTIVKFVMFAADTNLITAFKRSLFFDLYIASK